jgi:DNA polymerase IV (DinB-like DNA polymerase)
MDMRIVGHLDMDSFFASIEERDHPRFAGKPIVIGADPEEGRGRGVVSTANYKAREFGIRSALPITTAWRYAETARKKGAPATVFLTPSMGKYSAVSREVMGILREHAELVEEASVDEAFFDLSSVGSYDAAVEECRKIKSEIKLRERLTASVGIGPNKLIAKIASDRQKPDGLTVVRGDVAGEAEKFLVPLTLRTIPGVGPKTEERFKKLGARTVNDARRFTAEQLHEMMGKWGVELYEKLRGRDDAPLVTEWEAKSVGEQETFMHDTLDAGAVGDRLGALAAGVYARFVNDGFTSFKGITVTVRFADFSTFTRSKTLPAPVTTADPAAAQTLRFEAMRLLMPFLDRRENPQRKAIRLVGVRVEKLA